MSVSFTPVAPLRPAHRAPLNASKYEFCGQAKVDNAQFDVYRRARGSKQILVIGGERDRNGDDYSVFEPQVAIAQADSDSDAHRLRRARARAAAAYVGSSFAGTTGCACR